jgi:hypothetical protein
MTDAANALLTPPGLPTEAPGGPVDAQARMVAAASVSTGQHHALSDAQLASAKAHWIGQGLDPLAFDTAIGAPKEGRNEAGQFVPEAPEFAPSEYRPDYGPIAANVPVDALAKFHVQATSWASQVGLEPSVGQVMLEHLLQRSRAYSAMTPAERSLQASSERLDALRQCDRNPEVLKEKIRLAGVALQRANPEFNALLLERPGAFSAWSVLTLANSQLLFEAREKAKAAKAAQ